MNNLNKKKEVIEMGKEMPRVMLGSAVNEHKGYILDKWIERVKELTYPKLDILLVDNTRTDRYMERIITYTRGTPIRIIRDVWCSDYRGRMVTSHNKLREEFLKSKADYLFILDQDVIPPKDIVERLVKHKKDVVVGLYKLYLDTGETDAEKAELNCCWRARGELKNGVLRSKWLEDELLNTGLIEWTGGFATGCVLLSRKVLEDTIFRHEGNLQDSIYWKDVLNRGYKIYIDTDIMCEHYPSNWYLLLQKDFKELELMRGEKVEKSLELYCPTGIR